jgi:hypothetical protein
MKQNENLKIFIPCSIYHALRINSSKWKYCKVGHIDGKRGLNEQN